MLSSRHWLHLDWEKLRRQWRDVDLLLLLFPIALTVLGSAEIHSSLTNVTTGNFHSYWLQHLITGAIGLGAALLIMRSAYNQLLSWHWILYGISNLLLVLVDLVGETEGGAQSWLGVGGFNIQPSEFAKLSVIISLAAVIHRMPIRSPQQMGIAISVVILPWILIFIQPDLGTALVFGAITIVMLYWGGAKLGWLTLLVSPLPSAILFGVLVDKGLWPLWLIWVAAMGATAWQSLPWPRIGTLIAVGVNLISGGLGKFFWNLLQPYQQIRLTIFTDPSQDPLDSGYHLIQSRIAIGAGELWGRGLMQGTQTQLNFIPEQHTDFIFSAVGEELGFIGALAVLVAFWLISWRLIIVAQNAREDFGSLLAIGVFAMILFQVLVNIGMTIGLAPVTGLPLPWVSYGRSALLTNFLAIGLVESVATQRRRLKF
ncbi:rod shape-determining protein RodA [Leptolyngbya sp. FACHB-261]|uniref:rod shape-determining protein RodA n=1 Tax=Leptolyngbya sp. FACHB-261 TaxID=2692806 RepID=UPI001689465C|nr:rod shape-determining protein RodA [Leptolyngbya sp. FACHB-261]MBD2099661.1 rod shape-determining protein RodA [Leptolyngbya sp. FACHB-261]